MELCNIFVEDEFPPHLLQMKSHLNIVNESELHALSYYLRFSDSHLSLYLRQGDEVLKLSLDFDQELKKLDDQGLSYRSDPLKRLLRTKNKENELKELVEIGTGAGKDSMHFLALGLKVFSFERHPLIYCLCLDAKNRAQDKRLVNLNLAYGSAPSSLVKNAWVYFDPMFEHKKNRSAKSPKSMQVFQSLIKEADGKEVFDNLLAQAPARLIIKRTKKQKSFCKASFTVEGKSICYDVYLT